MGSNAATIHTSMVSAFRAALMAIVKATTGNRTDMSITGGNTFNRAAGSFLTDGFSIGDEIVATGFSGSPIVAYIKTVTALAIVTVSGGLTNIGSGASCAIVAGVPNSRAWDTETYSPRIGTAYVTDAYNFPSSDAVGIGGFEQHRIQGIFTFYYPQANGRLPLSKMAGLVRATFKPKGGLYYAGDSGTFMQATISRVVADPDWINQTVSATVWATTT